MNKQAGLWIDHRQAVVVILSGEGEEVKKIVSNVEKRVRFTGRTASEDGSAEDVRDRQYANHLAGYYDGIIALIRDAEDIQIFGPGEAKGELEDRLKQKGFRGRIAVETMDKMTERQIVAKVRAYFLAAKGPARG